MTKYMAYFLRKLDGSSGLWGISNFTYLIMQFFISPSNLLIPCVLLYMSISLLTFVIFWFIVSLSIRYMEKEGEWFLNPRDIDNVETVKKQQKDKQ